MSLSLQFSYFISPVINSLSCTFPITRFSSFWSLSISMCCVFCLVTLFWRTVYSGSVIPLTILLHVLYHLTSCLPLIHLLHIFVFFLFFHFFLLFLLTPTIYTMYNSTFSVLQLLRVTGSTVPIQFQSTSIHQSLNLLSY
jgi:hypothetical protein